MSNQRIEIKGQQKSQKKRREIMQARQYFAAVVQNQFAKGGPLVEHSQFTAITRGLEAMIETADNKVQVRRFEREGVEKRIVSFDKLTETFKLTESDTHQNYQLDNIDIVAMRIYGLIQ